MEMRSLLIFALDGRRFGLDVASVLECVWLPELTPVEQAPFWIAGMFSLRGTIVSVVDLNLCFGHSCRAYRLDDQVLVIQNEKSTIGMIVGEILELVEIPAQDIRPAPEFETHGAGPAALSAGIAAIGEELVTLLDIDRITHLETETGDDHRQPAVESPVFNEIAPEIRQTFHARAMALRSSLKDQAPSGRLGVAVVELGGEMFGVELGSVREFCNLAHCNPIPCCPAHIVGVISLRGNLLTLVDPGPALNLTTGETGNKAVILQSGSGVMAVAVDEIHDIVYLHRGDLQTPPAALRDRFGSEILGTAGYAGKTIAVFDLAALLARDEWTVDESV